MGEEKQLWPFMGTIGGSAGFLCVLLYVQLTAFNTLNEFFIVISLVMWLSTLPLIVMVLIALFGSKEIWLSLLPTINGWANVLKTISMVVISLCLLLIIIMVLFIPNEEKWSVMVALTAIFGGGALVLLGLVYACVSPLLCLYDSQRYSSLPTTPWPRPRFQAAYLVNIR